MKSHPFFGEEEMGKLNVLVTALVVLAVNPAVMASIVYDSVDAILYIDDVVSHTIDYSTYKDDWVFLDYNMPGNPGTHVDIVDGGEVTLARAHNRSSITMNGGTVVRHLQATDDSSIIFSGGTVGGVLHATDNGRITMTGGHSANRVQAVGESRITMSGGSVGNSLNVYYSGTIYLDGTDFEVNGIELTNGDKLSDFVPLVEDDDHDKYIGTITGTLADQSPLNTAFFIFNTEIYAGTADIYIIPEPCSLVLLGLGGLVLRRGKS